MVVGAVWEVGCASTNYDGVAMRKYVICLVMSTGLSVSSGLLSMETGATNSIDANLAGVEEGFYRSSGHVKAMARVHSMNAEECKKMVARIETALVKAKSRIEAIANIAGYLGSDAGVMVGHDEEGASMSKPLVIAGEREVLGQLIEVLCAHKKQVEERLSVLRPLAEADFNRMIAEIGSQSADDCGRMLAYIDSLHSDISGGFGFSFSASSVTALGRVMRLVAHSKLVRARMVEIQASASMGLLQGGDVESSYK